MGSVSAPTGAGSVIAWATSGARPTTAVVTTGTSKERRRFARFGDPVPVPALVDQSLRSAELQLLDAREALKDARRRVVQLEDALEGWRVLHERDGARRDGERAGRRPTDRPRSGPNGPVCRSLLRVAAHGAGITVGAKGSDGTPRRRHLAPRAPGERAAGTPFRRRRRRAGRLRVGHDRPRRHRRERAGHQRRGPWPWPDLGADRARPESLRVEVQDAAADLPHRVDADEARDGGRGLAIVDAFSHEWGCTVVRGASGKSVWFTMEREVPSG